MKKIQLAVACALLVSSLSMAGGAFAKEKEGAREDYVGKTTFTVKSLESAPASTVDAKTEDNKEEAKAEETKAEESKPATSEVTKQDNTITMIYFGDGGKNEK
ncbi:hypothetical protein [Brevibacillus sp. SYSU BS000544]|uniref:hypothetical protein n=1 Tax=Brevibacillus sp. SYSU BS000544 TaxID=3416443 RepID=UPI003CE52974